MLRGSSATPQSRKLAGVFSLAGCEEVTILSPLLSRRFFIARQVNLLNDPKPMSGSVIELPSFVTSSATARIPLPMRADLVEQAAQIIPDPPVLINMVSKRVKQLALGRPALVERRPGLREADIALLEIIQGKIKIQDVIAEE